MLGVKLDWVDLREFLPAHAEPRLRRSALASSFVAAHELARHGKAENRQEENFGPLHLRRAAARHPPLPMILSARWRRHCSPRKSR
jgi:segregation and condensation protein A